MKVKRGGEPQWYKDKCKRLSMGDSGLYKMLLSARLPDGSLPSSFEGMLLLGETAYSMDE